MSKLLQQTASFTAIWNIRWHCGSCQCRCSSNSRRIVIRRRFEIDLTIGLDNTSSRCRLHFPYVQHVILIVVLEADGVTYCHARKCTERALQATIGTLLVSPQDAPISVAQRYKRTQHADSKYRENLEIVVVALQMLLSVATHSGCLKSLLPVQKGFASSVSQKHEPFSRSFSSCKNSTLPSMACSSFLLEH